LIAAYLSVKPKSRRQRDLGKLLTMFDRNGQIE